jgi:hypothetical protein
MRQRSSYYEYNFQMSCFVGLELAGRLGGWSQGCIVVLTHTKVGGSIWSVEMEVWHIH